MPAKAKEQNCGNCRYMYQRTKNAALICHRFPPQIVVFSDCTSEFWPEVMAYEWCGEWKFKPKS